MYFEKKCHEKIKLLNPGDVANKHRMCRLFFKNIFLVLSHNSKIITKTVSDLTLLLQPRFQWSPNQGADIGYILIRRKMDLLMLKWFLQKVFIRACKK